ncbi:GspH/FimT family pseudopilin [Desulfonatronum thiodismutans]|uniref:GspH/FimT family pseudopilin n=1 Tax=Desulfonatronum thiodismutans TaxID=159290 RepID=UPI00068CA082|nr:GspH/FimT family pseudopilin [Desulfonatronum thiodismutans]
MPIRSSPRNSSGLTFIEVLVAILIALVLMAVSAPYLAGMYRSAGMSTTAHEFLSTLSYARSEAIKRNQRVTICKSADGLQCVTQGGWEQGWIVFVDAGNLAQVDEAKDILRVRGPLRGETILTGNMPVRNYVSYVGNGSTQYVSGAFQAGTLTLCRQERGVKFVLARAGRVRTEKTTCQ